MSSKFISQLIKCFLFSIAISGCDSTGNGSGTPCTSTTETLIINDQHCLCAITCGAKDGPTKTCDCYDVGGTQKSCTPGQVCYEGANSAYVGGYCRVFFTCNVDGSGVCDMSICYRSSSSGGAPSTGVTSATSGGVSSGGTSTIIPPPSGGTVSTGGAIAAGGVIATGGKPSTGGTISTGGMLTTGGTKSTGGSSVRMNTGGNATGGHTEISTSSPIVTGGESSTGGTTATGGTHATGGVQTTGGSPPATGGTSATGGNPPITGGTSAVCASDAPTPCGSSCVNLQNDVSNCGACGNACPTGSNGSRSCSGGLCSYLCTTGYANCNNSVLDGCEVYTLSDSSNCGTCGNVCSTGNACMSSLCKSVCGTGATYCSGSCVNLLSSNTNCGTCGNTCAAGTTCSNGSCVSICASGQMYCNGSCVNPQTDSRNCSSCGNTCSSGYVCAAGICKPAGYAFGVCSVNSIYFGGFDSACGNKISESTSVGVSLDGIPQCLTLPPSGSLHGKITFDYYSSADTATCYGDLPVLTLYLNSWTTVYELGSFQFPSCQAYGSSSFIFTIPPEGLFYNVTLTTGDWCSSVRVTSITQN